MTPSLRLTLAILGFTALATGCAKACTCTEGDAPACVHGACAVSGGFAGCACEDGYAGVLCESCAAGYQDHDGDQVCQAGCALAGLDCGANGSCADTSGTAVCACAEGYAGADCRSCADGFQDNDQDGTCTPDCSSVVMVCSDHGSCDESSGTTVCACAEGYSGADCSSCADGYQDNDDDGACSPSCSAITCEAHQICDDSSGTASCDCAPGFGLDGGTSCDFQGIVQDPSFQAATPVWTVAPDAGVIDPAAQGNGDLGTGSLASNAACSYQRIEQEVEVPTRDASGGLRLSWEARAICGTGVCFAYDSPMLWLNGFVDHGSAVYNWLSGSTCLGERAYGGKWKLGLSEAPKVACGYYDTGMIFDHVRIDPDPSCPLPGEVSNGDFEGTGGWDLTFASLQPNVGSNGSHGLALAPTTNCDLATATGSVSIPTTGVNALQVRYGGVAGSEFDVLLADWRLAHLVARGGGLFDTVTLCLPAAFEGVAPRLKFSMPYGTGGCSSADPRRLYIDDVALVSDPSCGADATVVNGSFERTDPALGWYTSFPTVNGNVVGSLETTTFDAKVGARSLHINLLNPCAHGTASTVITVPAPHGNAGPAVKYWYRNVGSQTAFRTSTSNGTVPFTTTWTARTECLPPAMAGMPMEFALDGFLGGGCFDSIHEEIFVDDVQATTDSSCPAQ